MHARKFFLEAEWICQRIDHDAIDRLAARLSVVKKVYIIGLGGSLANAIHMAADLRKLCEVDAEAFDNIAELTARANDEGMATIFSGWLSRATKDDALVVLSVGGGAPGVSAAIIRAVHTFCGAIFGIVGPDGGYTAERAEIAIRVPVENKAHITPQTEAFQALVWHCLVSHPLLQKHATKW